MQSWRPRILQNVCTPETRKQTAYFQSASTGLSRTASGMTSSSKADKFKIQDQPVLQLILKTEEINI